MLPILLSYVDAIGSFTTDQEKCFYRPESGNYDSLSSILECQSIAAIGDCAEIDPELTNGTTKIERH